MNIFPLITNTQQLPITREQLAIISMTLELEYAGGSVKLDESNIGSFTNVVTDARLQSFALHHNIISPLIDAENTAYITPPTRVGVLPNDKQTTKKVQLHIQDVYKDLRFDLVIDTISKITALTGTTLVRPIYDEELERWVMIVLSPSDKSVKLVCHPLYPSILMGLSYEIEVSEDITHTLTWTKDELKTLIKDGKKETTTTEPHSYGRIPFSLLRYGVGTKDIWGYPDVELYTLAKHRSLLLANTMARTHLSDMEKLIISGMTPEDAVASIQSKLIVLPIQESKHGTPIQPTAEYLSPSAQDALDLFKIYIELLAEIRDTRGHTRKMFSRGADAPSAESIRLGSIELQNKLVNKKKYLTDFEQDVWEVIQLENNAHDVLPSLPDGISMRIDFLPDPYSFNSAADEVNYFTAAIAKGVETPVSWIKQRDNDYSDEEALAKYEENKAFNEENNINTLNPMVEPTDEEPNNDVPEGTED